MKKSGDPERIIYLEKVSYANRFVNELFNAGSISLLIIIILISFLSPLSAWHIIFSTFYIIYMVMWANLAKTYIIEIIDGGENILINYYVRDKPLGIQINKNQLDIEYKGAGLGDPKGLRLKFIANGTVVIKQYLVGRWDKKNFEKIQNYFVKDMKSKVK